MDTSDYTMVLPHVLIVDDDMSMRMLARAALERAGFIVREAENGREALQRLKGAMPDLILLDVMMPELDGFATCSAVRQLPGASHVPILMMTGLDDVDSINRAYEAGATDFATKPINYLLLAHRIRYIVRAKHTADELRASESRLANAQRIARLGHFDWDIDRGRILCSAQLYQLFGLADGDGMTARPDLQQHIHPDDREAFIQAIDTALRTHGRYSLEHRVLRGDGSTRIMYQEGEVYAGAEGPHISATMQDITERRQMEREVLNLTHYDGMTGLPNRTLMQRDLAEAVANARRNRHVVAVLAINVDHFARVNDTLGHGQGDELLKIVAARLAACLRSSPIAARADSDRYLDGDMLARVAGDEFVAIVSVQSLDDAAVTARRIMEALAKPCILNETAVTVSASIGISGYPVDGSDPETLLQRAGSALHHAKDLGRNRWEFSTASINARVSERFNLETALRAALSRGQFELHYQPKVQLDSDAVVGVEALLRWRHPEQGMVPPSTFISVAEETGLIVPIGEWILYEACRQIQTWRAQGLPPLTAAVNLSPVQFRTTGLHLMVAATIAESSIDPSVLELELTESLLMEEREASIRMMNRLRSLGVSLSIDDFGTGYSSLAYLRRFPINSLKIDRTFVSDSADNADSGAIVTAIIALAHSLRLKVVAEGVETKQQLRFLRARNCDAVQGYLHSRPLPADEFATWLRQRLPGVIKVASSA